jgi:hypothetical protein
MSDSLNEYIEKWVKEVLKPQYVECRCAACQKDCYPHASSCAVHNEPAYPTGPCDCRTAP